MESLVARSDQAATQAEEKFSETVFGSAKAFVEMYRSGMLNRRSEEISELAKAAEAGYQNIAFAGTDLQFISQNEIALKVTQDAAEYWSMLVGLKAAYDALEGSPEIVYVSNADRKYTGFLLTESVDDEVSETEDVSLASYDSVSETGEESTEDSTSDLELEKTSTVRAFKNFDKFQEAHSDLLDEVEDGVWAIDGSQIQNLDFSGLKALQDAVESNPKAY